MFCNVLLGRTVRSTAMLPIVTDEVACVECLSVCLSVTIVSPAKPAEPIEMLFGLWTLMGQRKHVLEFRPGSRSPMGRDRFEGEGAAHYKV